MTASAAHVTVAGGSFEDKEGGERTPRVLLKSNFLGVTSTGQQAREIPRSDGIDLKVVSTRQGLENESRTMARARATDSNIPTAVTPTE